MLVLAHVGLLLEVQPLATWFYPLAWWSYIAIADGVLTARGGPSLFRRPPARLLGLAGLSLPFWFQFEVLNLRLENWYYVGVPESWPFRWVGISISFATVLPLLWVTWEAFLHSRLIGRCRVPALQVTERLLSLMRATGWIFLLLPLLFPRWAFPLVWGFLALVLEPANYQAGRPSLLRDWEQGRARRLVALLTAGLLCGLLWECWNYLAVGKWIYTVPFFSGTKLFEMPLAGFLGFPALAVEGFVFHTAAAGWWRTFGRPARALVAAAVAVFCLGTLWAMDRHTVDAVVPTLDGVAVLSTEQHTVLATRGLRSLKDLAALSERQIAGLAAETSVPPETLVRARDWARLARLKGMGNANAAVLWTHGVRSVGDLARYTPDTLAQRLGPQDAPDPRKLEVWIRAASREPPARGK